ncbi:MAG TPA: UDP-N-acetylmuramoyl-tripeptide--D-alanyl-D-alanine ligase [Rhodothermales bacterium]|nr:UDP-N-acetylmuramoyl-tripeptide--D-alanyl-D-alanine ligase [Rhodothermales bacterium]
MNYPKYSKDTRTIAPGDWYVAIRGEVFDGHKFIPDAIAKGAVGVITEDEFQAGLPEITVVRVENAIEHLVKLAQERIQLLNPKIIGITGSVGKTSTRTAMAHVLAAEFPVVVPEGNLNTPLGLALTILNGLTQDNSVMVLEMGARFVGDIAELTTAFRPDVSFVTTVQGVHLETFGNIENIAHEKGMIVEALESDGIACLNYDDPRVREMKARCKGRVLFYSAHEEAVDLPASLIPKPYPLLGGHAIYTMLAAYAAGFALGMDREIILKQITTLRTEKGRLSKLPAQNGGILIDDTYNASPVATLSALRLLAEMPGRRIACLGDMLELGEEEAEGHELVVKEAVESAEICCLVGPRFQSSVTTLGLDGIYWFPDSKALAAAISKGEVFNLSSGDVVLVKGSQGLRMERVAEVVLDPACNPADVLVRQEMAWKAK